MIAWLLSNLGTITVLLVLAGVIAAIVLGLLRGRKAGKPACGGCPGCGFCGSCGSFCHGKPLRS